MKRNLAKQLNQINLDFYKMTDQYFDNSRQYMWKGWDRVLKYLPKDKPLRVLDVGCGNGRFYEFLHKNGYSFTYVGIDSSEELLTRARKSYPEGEFFLMDITEGLEIKGSYDLIVCYGVYHHIPGRNNRLELTKQLNGYLSTNGLLMISFWQFVNSKRLMERVVDWNVVGLTEDDVEEGDYLLDWQRGTRAVRYCNYLSPENIRGMYTKCNIPLTEEFYMDGKEGNLNYYVISKETS